MNRPAPVVKWMDDYAEELEPTAKYSFQKNVWRFYHYAYYCGLDNRWEMFGRQSRFNWIFNIQAQYSFGEDPITLPLPLQTERSLFESLVIDFKEPKFHLNLYGRDHVREGYARYLARKYTDKDGRHPLRIIYKLDWQNILPLEIASEKGEHLEDRVTTITHDTVDTFLLFL